MQQDHENEAKNEIKWFREKDKKKKNPSKGTKTKIEISGNFHDIRDVLNVHIKMVCCVLGKTDPE